jgi:hypothetical protein
MEKRLKLIRLIGYGTYTDREVKGLLQRQAELTRKVIRKEVVDWIEQERSDCMDCSTPYKFTSLGWQAKLKDWGIV